HLEVGGLAAELDLERLVRLAELVRLETDEARHPVLAAQLVEDGAADARRAVGLELDPALEVEAVDRVHEPEDAGALEIFDVDRLRERDEQALRDVADERE